MGLDNGIIVNKTGIEAVDAKLSKLASYVYDDGDYEIAYWRKCYNVREAISDAIGGISDNDVTGLYCCDIEAIIKALRRFNRKNWESSGWYGSIWTWKEIKSSHRATIRRLRRLLRLMRKHDLAVFFYDSY